MKNWLSGAMALLLTACASVEPAQDIANLASMQLLQLETELHAAAKSLRARYERQQEFVQRNLEIAQEAETYTEQLYREWNVSDNKEASRLYDAVLSTRSQEPVVHKHIDSAKMRVNTKHLKRAIKNLGALNESLAEHGNAESFLRFGYDVQKKYEELNKAEDD